MRLDPLSIDIAANALQSPKFSAEGVRTTKRRCVGLYSTS